MLWFLHLFFYSLLTGAQKVAKIASEGAIVLKVNVKADNAPALQLNLNVIQMFARVVGLGIQF